MGVYSGYLKRHNGLTWEILYPKTTIAQVENLSTQLTNMQEDIDGKYGSASDLPYADSANKGAVRVNIVGSALYLYTT